MKSALLALAPVFAVLAHRADGQQALGGPAAHEAVDAPSRRPANRGRPAATAASSGRRSSGLLTMTRSFWALAIEPAVARHVLAVAVEQPRLHRRRVAGHAAVPAQQAMRALGQHGRDRGHATAPHRALQAGQLRPSICRMSRPQGACAACAGRTCAPAGR